MDTRCSQENLPRVMDDKDRWRESGKSMLPVWLDNDDDDDEYPFWLHNFPLGIIKSLYLWFRKKLSFYKNFLGVNLWTILYKCVYRHKLFLINGLCIIFSCGTLYKTYIVRYS